MLPVAMSSAPRFNKTATSFASSVRGAGWETGSGAGFAAATGNLGDQSNLRSLRSAILPSASRSAMASSIAPTKPGGGTSIAPSSSAMDSCHALAPTGSPAESRDPAASPLIRTPAAPPASNADTPSGAGSSAGRAPLGPPTSLGSAGAGQGGAFALWTTAREGDEPV